MDGVALDGAALDELVARVRELAPSVVAGIVPHAAAELAALALHGSSNPEEFSGPGPWWAGEGGPADPGTVADAVVLQAVEDVDRSLGDRLVGGLAPVAAGWEGAPWLAAASLLPGHVSSFAVATTSTDGAALAAVRFLGAMRPGALAALRAMAETVAPLVGEVFVVAEDAGETGLLAAHGVAHLGPAVATVLAVLAGTEPGPADRSQAVAAAIGVASGVALLWLRADPEPDGYREAVLARERAEYGTGNSAGNGAAGWRYGTVRVSGHRFALTEGAFPEGEVEGEVDVSRTGLAAAVPGGVVVRTGTADGYVHVGVVVAGQEPEPSDESDVYEDVVEVSYRADRGFASVLGAGGVTARDLRHVTPPRAGDYRVRVESWGRDAASVGGQESYTLTVWPAAPAPEVVRRAVERLGYRLRGEPEEEWPARPELAYAWVRASVLGQAATVTVVTGSTLQDVVRAFGGDPALPVPRRPLQESYTCDPWVSVLDLGDAVLAVEDNGWQGAGEAVLRAASAGGRAASMYWNVNAANRLSFAEHGRVLDAFEVGLEAPAGVPEVGEALAALQFDHGDELLAALLAVERFTGRGLTPDDLARIEAADVAYRLAPPAG